MLGWVSRPRGVIGVVLTCLPYFRLCVVRGRTHRRPRNRAVFGSMKADHQWKGKETRRCQCSRLTRMGFKFALCNATTEEKQASASASLTFLHHIDDVSVRRHNLAPCPYTVRIETLYLSTPMSGLSRLFWWFGGSREATNVVARRQMAPEKSFVGGRQC